MRILTGGLCVAAAALCVSGGVAMGADKGLTDQSFVKQAALDGMTEVELGNVAAEKAASDDAKTFAAHMVKDHSKANDELATLAKSKNLKVPTQLDVKHRAMIDALKMKSGASFDAAYAKNMVSDHNKAISLFTKETQSSDPDLAAFATKTLPVLKEHKKMADALNAKVGKTS
ncbi:MAG: putative outer membrane protein [Gammaproteobacteria bacterium]|nr:putative outer membrane protein [Gammaproteobacteria bacterium]